MGHFLMSPVGNVLATPKHPSEGIRSLLSALSGLAYAQGLEVS